MARSKHNRRPRTKRGSSHIIPCGAMDHEIAARRKEQRQRALRIWRSQLQANVARGWRA